MTKTKVTPTMPNLPSNDEITRFDGIQIGFIDVKNAKSKFARLSTFKPFSVDSLWEKNNMCLIANNNVRLSLSITVLNMLDISTVHNILVFLHHIAGLPFTGLELKIHA
jgi:hypothetical protein